MRLNRLETSRYTALRKVIYILDGAIIALSLVLAFLIQTNLRGLIPVLRTPPDPSEYALVAFLTLPIWLVLVWSFNPDDVQNGVKIMKDLQDAGIPAFLSLERGAFALKKAREYYSLKSL